ncbi:signal peptidase I [Actinokineospora pegani]|uniref:signal peptidase I n=1 Tax=Actinokineospora pegani TaxID=2654637 RepID=UPI0012E9C55D|nr:signal peptidase I [Actinokineospora pegani]
MPDGADPEDEPTGRKKLPLWVELPILLAVALVISFLVQSFVARVYVIPSESMEATLHGCPGCTGDRVVVDRVVYAFGDPEPGEVVVFARPATWNHSEHSADRSENTVVRWLQDVGSVFGLATSTEDDVVKRVVAVGGQTVRCCDGQNRVVVDDRPLDEPYLHWEGIPRQEEFPVVSVPQGMLFVMGDNRNNSGDSRTQGGGGANGLVPVDDVIGKARAVILPPSRWRGVGDHDPQALSAPAWQQGIPLGVGLAAAWPALWLGRRLREVVAR